MAAKPIKVSGFVDRRLHRRVKFLADERQVPFGVIVTAAIETYLERVEKRPSLLNELPKDRRATAAV